ncbi:hypothetical protein [Actinomadura hibisca]|uniref:hypothetical protein n=1 Tax=Actinomadura hibisca TaxID=68565 RepID=UPI00082DFA79|nr:hypothetical protein [Actinomadura hibisca]
MAYLVLPGTLDEHERLVAAHWIVDRSRRGGSGETEEVYARLSDRVLHQAAHHPDRPRRRLTGGSTRLGPWLRVRPAAPSGDDLALTSALAALPPQARAAYVLRHLEELPEETVHERLAALGVADPDAALREAAAVDERVPPEIRDQVLARPTLDPTVVRLHARLHGRPGYSGRRAAAVATVAALVAAGGAVILTGGLGEAHVSGFADRSVGRADRVTATPAGAWRRTTRLDLDTWPARGDLAGDGDFTGEALRAWNGDVKAAASGGVSTAPPARDPQLLYAGRLGNRRIALLHDADRVARYTVSGENRTLEIFPEGRTLPGGASPLKLAAGRYLLPPWVTGLRASYLGGAARWRNVPVRGGVTGPVRAASGGCWRGPVFELRQPEIAHGRPYTMADLGGLQSANLMYQPPPPAPVRRLGPHQIDAAPDAEPDGFTLWGRLGCAPSAPTSLDRTGRGDVESATAWEFWRGDLPDKGGRGRWICTRYAYGGGRSVTYTTLLDGRGQALLTGRRDDTWDCSRLQRDVASGTWWRSPKGRWHYLAAASRRVTVLTADGPFVRRPTVRGGLLTVAGPVAEHAPDGRVTLAAADHQRRAMPVFQADPG